MEHKKGDNCMINSLSIIICTKDRILEVARCIKAIYSANYPSQVPFIEIIVIDDGIVPGALLECLKDNVPACFEYRYVQNTDSHGLFQSRLLGINTAKGDILLFLDDDVEIANDYLERLANDFLDYPYVGGIGGIDILLSVKSLFQIYQFIFFMASFKPGRLTASGYSGSLSKWIHQSQPFFSEYLSGCNMAFRKKAVDTLKNIEWLKGYSLGEDLALSYFVRKKYVLLVDPRLHVFHRLSKRSREGDEILARSRIINHYQLLKLYNARQINYLAFYWTFFGYIILDLAHPSRWRLIPLYLKDLRNGALTNQ